MHFLGESGRKRFEFRSSEIDSDAILSGKIAFLGTVFSKVASHTRNSLIIQ